MARLGLPRPCADKPDTPRKNAAAKNKRRHPRGWRRAAKRFRRLGYFVGTV